jgi:hypothetical protein
VSVRALLGDTDVGIAAVKLSKHLADVAPTETLGRVELGQAGGEFSELRSDAPITNWDDALRKLGVDPEAFEVDGASIRVSSWQQSKRTEDGDRDVVTLYSYSGRITTRREAIDLPALFNSASKKPRHQLKPAPSGNVTVVVLADAQIGKVGARGGTPELIDRLVEKREKLAAHLSNRRPSRTVLLEGGDLFENFESGGNPMFTNDLSLSEQMDLAGTVLYQFIEAMHRHGRVDVVAVPSNHTAWRRGAVNLGRPADDLGLFVHKQVERVAAAAGLDCAWTIPDVYDESVTIDVDGTVVGLVHGNQFRPLKAIEWWGKQAHGGQPVGKADVLVSCHYHSLAVMPTGRNPYTGRTKWWLQAPTLDNGSDWFRNKAGEDSDPGLLVFDITPDGFDLQSLTVL